MATETREAMLTRWNTPPQVDAPTNDGLGSPVSTDPYAAVPPSPTLHDVTPMFVNHAVFGD